MTRRPLVGRGTQAAHGNVRPSQRDWRNMLALWTLNAIIQNSGVQAGRGAIAAAARAARLGAICGQNRAQSMVSIEWPPARGAAAPCG
jgi:hypothetical protein